ncbi:MAG: hypothetical protein AAGI15_15195 [Pseudomonadota bacterium]
MDRRSRTFLIAEGVVIIASILMAFAIQAAWEELQENQEVERILKTVLKEHIQNVAAIEQWEASFGPLADRSMQNALVASADPSALSIDEFNQLLADVSYYAAPNVRFYSIENMIKGGKLALIEDADLREALGSWYETVEFYSRKSRTEERYLDETFIPFLIENAHLPSIIGRAGPEGYNYGVLGSSETPTQRDHRSLLQSNELIGHLTWKYLYVQDYRLTNSAYLENHRTLGEQLVAALGLPTGEYARLLEQQTAR